MKLTIEILADDVNTERMEAFIAAHKGLILEYQINRGGYSSMWQPDTITMSLILQESSVSRVLKEIGGLTTTTPAEKAGWKVGDHGIRTVNGHTSADLMEFEADHGVDECSFYNITSDEFMVVDIQEVTLLRTILLELDNHVNTREGRCGGE